MDTSPEEKSFDELPDIMGDGNTEPTGEGAEKVGQEQEEEKYQDEVEINGIKIRIGWAPVEKEYTLAFPQSMRPDGAMKPEFEKAGFYTPDIKTASDNPAVAKKVFDFAVSATYKETDLVKLFGMVDEYVGQLLSSSDAEDDDESE